MRFANQIWIAIRETALNSKKRVIEIRSGLKEVNHFLSRVFFIRIANKTIAIQQVKP